MNQFGLAGGHVPVESFLIEGQSRFNFMGLSPVDFYTCYFNLTLKYLSSKTFKEATLSASMFTFSFYKSPSSDSKNVYCCYSTASAIIFHSFSNLKHSSLYYNPHCALFYSSSSLVASLFDVSENYLKPYCLIILNISAYYFYWFYFMDLNPSAIIFFIIFNIFL